MRKGMRLTPSALKILGGVDRVSGAIPLRALFRYDMTFLLSMDRKGPLYSPYILP